MTKKERLDVIVTTCLNFFEVVNSWIEKEEAEPKKSSDRAGKNSFDPIVAEVDAREESKFRTNWPADAPSHRIGRVSRRSLPADRSPRLLARAADAQMDGVTSGVYVYGRLRRPGNS